jgi:sugar phosphate isomerase/epimerase
VTLPENTRYGAQAPLVVINADAARIVRVGRLCAECGRRLLVENGEQSPGAWRELIHRLPPDLVGLCLDLGNAHLAGAGHVPPAVGEPALAYLGWPERVEAIHLHDTDADRGVRNCPLGQGSLELATVAAALRDCAVEAPIVLEVDGSAAELRQSLALARDLFSAER